MLLHLPMSLFIFLLLLYQLSIIENHLPRFVCYLLKYKLSYYKWSLGQLTMFEKLHLKKEYNNFQMLRCPQFEN